MVRRLLKIFGLCKVSEFTENLDFARSVGKRLDEHRELVESIVKSSNFLKDNPWHIGHMATQDDYLMRLFYMRHGVYPATGCHCSITGEYVRERPLILGECQLPEYRAIA